MTQYIFEWIIILQQFIILIIFIPHSTQVNLIIDG